MFVCSRKKRLLEPGSKATSPRAVDLLNQSGVCAGEGGRDRERRWGHTPFCTDFPSLEFLTHWANPELKMAPSTLNGAFLPTKDEPS